MDPKHTTKGPRQRLLFLPFQALQDDNDHPCSNGLSTRPVFNFSLSLNVQSLLWNNLPVNTCSGNRPIQIEGYLHVGCEGNRVCFIGWTHRMYGE